MATPPSPRGRGESASDYAARLETSSPELVWGPSFDDNDGPTEIPGVGTFQRSPEVQAQLDRVNAAKAAEEARMAQARKTAAEVGARTFSPEAVNPTRTQTQIELDAQRLLDRATNVPTEQRMKEGLIGMGLGALVPMGGMMYGLANAANRMQDRTIANQLLQQEEYKGGLFGTGFLAGPQAASYVPVYDENDNLVGSIGVDEAGKAIRYTGDRIEDYTGFGAELVTRDPFADMDTGPEDSEPTTFPLAAQGPAPAAPAASGAPPQVPLVPLPTAFVGQQPGMPMQRPMIQPMTQATQVPQMQPYRPGAPAPQGIMSTQQALRPSYLNIGRNNPLQQ